MLRWLGCLCAVLLIGGSQTDETVMVQIGRNTYPLRWLNETYQINFETFLDGDNCTFYCPDNIRREHDVINNRIMCDYVCQQGNHTEATTTAEYIPTTTVTGENTMTKAFTIKTETESPLTPNTSEPITNTLKPTTRKTTLTIKPDTTSDTSSNRLTTIVTESITEEVKSTAPEVPSTSSRTTRVITTKEPTTTETDEEASTTELPTNFTKFVISDSCLGMTVPFMRSYALEVIKTCHQRGIFAMGGMAAQIPIRHDELANQKALALVRQDKEREASDGHDGTWVAHPGLVNIAKDAFGQYMPGQNQLGKQLNFAATNKDLTALPEGKRTEEGFRHNINVSLGYLDSWLRGVGCVPLYNVMEDAATAEISRAQLWQWLKHDAKLEDGSTIDANMMKQTIAAETERRLIRAGSVVNRLPEAAELLEKFTTEENLSDFLTFDAYDKLVSEGH